jgi:UPF0716 family protein affecting phage T7 exclusion
MDLILMVISFAVGALIAIAIGMSSMRRAQRDLQRIIDQIEEERKK